VKKNEIKGFTNAVSMTVDAKNNVYVLDAGANQVIKYSEELVYKIRNGKQGWLEGQFDSPTYIDGSSGLDIFITDGNNRRVQRYDLDLNPIATLKTNLSDFPIDLRYQTPIATLVLNSNQLYVIDGDNNRIVIYKDGKVPSKLFGFYTSGKGQMSRPVKMEKDGNNNIYVLDKEMKSILKYDNLGNYLSTLSIKNLESFSISGDILYMLSNKEIVLYDLNKNSIISTKIIPSKDVKKKFREILILNNKKYFLLGKNSISLWQEN